MKLLDEMYKYEKDPTRTVGATERTRDAGQTDGRTDGRTEWNQYTPPTTSLCLLPVQPQAIILTTADLVSLAKFALK